MNRTTHTFNVGLQAYQFCHTCTLFLSMTEMHALPMDAEKTGCHQAVHHSPSVG